MKRLIALLLALLLAIPFAGAETVVYVQGGTADRVHLRAYGASNAQSLGLYFSGTVAVQLAQPYNGWVRVQIGSVTGYMHQDYLSYTNSTSQAPTYVVENTSSTWVNMRAAAKSGADVMTTCQNGTRVLLLGETSDGWSYVRVNHLTGYIMTQFLKPEGSQSGAGYSQAVEVNAYTTIVGQSVDNGYIHRYYADNGQEIYFTSSEYAPRIMRHDVNFDGRDDLVLYTAEAANNLYCQFYVFRDGVYNLVTDNGNAVSLCNYQLYPGKNMVATHVNNGSGGALFEDTIYRWNGGELETVRIARSDKMRQWSAGNSGVTTVYDDLLHMEVLDFTYGVADGLTLWQRDNVQTVSMSGSIYNEIQRALWQGL